MVKNWWYRFSFFLFLIVFSLASLVPTFFNLTKESAYPLKSKMTLGLDLQGGLYIVLGIDFQKVYRDEVKNYVTKATYMLKDEGILAEVGMLNTDDSNDPKQILIIKDLTQVESAQKLMRDNYGYPLRLTSAEKGNLVYGLQTIIKEEIEKSAIEKSTEILRNRIDEFGVSEPDIASLGKDKVVVQLPGVKDVEKAKQLIGKTAKLAFKFVNSDFTPNQLIELIKKANDAGIKEESSKNFADYVFQLNQFLQKELPAGHEILFEKTVNKVTLKTETMIPYLVESLAPITGEDLQDAHVAINQQEQRPYVALSFKPAGSARFSEVTEKNVGRLMAIVLDNNIYSAPRINQKISGGEAQITLGAMDYNTTLNEAKELSLVLRAGALPVQLEFQEQRIVGPSLGADSIKKATYASVIAAMCIFLWVMYYYRVAGVFAVITLIANVIFTLGCLVGLEATLTLPGIAGIALTIGMAVDGNIIIFERIREELKKGASNLASVEAGFSRAFWTIVDANLTTLIAGLALLNFGTGPVRGFAVTLIIGVIATVYTSYFVSKIFFDYSMTKNKGKTLNI